MVKYLIYIHFNDGQVIELQSENYDRDGEIFIIIGGPPRKIIKRYIHLSNVEQIVIEEI